MTRVNPTFGSHDVINPPSKFPPHWSSQELMFTARCAPLGDNRVGVFNRAAMPFLGHQPCEST
eukprot:2433643-Pyramimonas_sp.AAC.1